MRKVLFFTICCLTLCAFVDCKRKPATNNELANKATIEPVIKTYEQGLDTCTAILVEHMGLDSVTARKKCLCLYNSYEEIDSTFSKMEPNTRQEFMMKHAEEVRAKCDSLIPTDKVKF